MRAPRPCYERSTAPSALERAFGRRDTVLLVRVDLDRGTQRSGQSLEAGFSDVVVVVAIERLDVESRAGIHGECMKPFARQFGIEIADLGERELCSPYEVRPARDIDGDAGQRLVHRKIDACIAPDALAVAERLANRLAERNA